MVLYLNNRDGTQTRYRNPNDFRSESAQRIAERNRSRNINAPQQENTSTDRYEAVASSPTGTPILRDNATGETFIPVANTNQGTLYQGEPRYAQQQNYTQAPPKQSFARGQAQRFNPFSTGTSDFQDPSAMAAVKGLDKVNSYTENKARQYNDGTGFGRVKALPFAVANLGGRGVRGAVQYAGENPERFFTQQVLTGGSSVLLGSASRVGLNYAGRTAAARTGSLAVGNRVVQYSNYALGAVGFASAAYSVKGKSAEEVGAATPQIIAAAAGFNKGFKANGGVGAYVEGTKPLGASDFEYRKVGGNIQGTGTQRYVADVNYFGKSQSVPFEANFNVIADKSAGSGFYNAQVQSVGRIPVKTGAFNVEGNWRGGFTRRTLALRDGSTGFVSRSEAATPYFSDGVTNVRQTRSRFAVLNMKNTPEVTRTGASVSYTEKFSYRDTRVSRATSDFVSMFSVNSRRVGYTGGTSGFASQESRLPPEFTQKGLDLLQARGQYSPRYTRESLWSNKRGGFGSAEFSESSIIPQSRGKRGFLDLYGLPIGRSGYARSSLVPFGFASGSKSLLENKGSLRGRTIQDVAPRTFVRPDSKPSFDIVPVSITGTQREPRTSYPTSSSQTIIPSRQSSSFAPPVNKTPAPPLTPFIPGFPMITPSFKAGWDMGSSNRSFRYSPDLTSTLFNIRGAAPKNLTGLELRPLARTRKKRK